MDSPTTMRNFSRRMNRLLAAFAFGVMLWVGSGVVAIFLPHPIGPFVPYVVAAMVTGFLVMGISSLLRSSTRCPACHNLFCGPNNDQDSPGAKNVLTLSCKNCGLKVNG